MVSRQRILHYTLTALIVGSGAVWSWSRLSAYQQEIADLKEQSISLVFVHLKHFLNAYESATPSADQGVKDVITEALLLDIALVNNLEVCFSELDSERTQTLKAAMKLLSTLHLKSGISISEDRFNC